MVFLYVCLDEAEKWNMKNNLYTFVREQAEVRLGDDLFLCKSGYVVAAPQLISMDMTAVCVCLCGEASGWVNLTPMFLRKSHMSIILAGDIVECQNISDDFQAVCLFMSPRFLSELGLPRTFDAYMSVRNHPVIPLEPKQLASMQLYFDMIEGILQTENPFKEEVVRHLTCAFFYGAGYYFHSLSEPTELSHKEQLVRRFLETVQLHYRNERKLQFYADCLNLSSGYLSTAVKEYSGFTASEWIERFVLQEAKALLKSTDLTIQQISDRLNFPSQSFFGKFFKRRVGLSPKGYRSRE